MTFIDQHAGVFGVEPICRVLTQHGCPISTSTYYAAKNRPPSPRAVRDAELDEHITRIHADNYGVYGARKVWQQLLREGHRVARCTVERRMRVLGLQGARRGRKIRTTTPDPGHARAADRLRRDFTAQRPNATWVADFTHVSAWCGVVYVAFVVDIYSRAIVGSTRLDRPYTREHQPPVLRLRIQSSLGPSPRHQHVLHDQVCCDKH
ncbi:hypothetical protein GCM10022224_035380 [Nonomuraea antimicrobica]|uniref:HTH-like domain-containing protein n=1 Tax=Nonomuraea antimicrobica TaxID=561173 RepID=A0ABP7BUI1_9ACTN